MAMSVGAVRSCLASLPKSLLGRDAAALFGTNTAGYATEISKKDAAYLLDSRDDPEVDAAISGYLKSAYAGGKESASKDDGFALASKVEKKYMAAQIVSSGIQTIALPLGFDAKDTAPVKRYVAQLYKLGAQAGFEPPCVEVDKRLAEKAATAETVKEFLVRIEPLTSPDFHAALGEALVAVEAETNAAVMMDGASEGYKKFAAKVADVASAHKIPTKVLVDAKAAPSDSSKKAFQAWAQSAAVADAAAEIAVLQGSAAALLDKHLTKTAEQVRAEQAASLAALHKRLDAAKGAPWAVQFKQDLANVAWFDRAVAANPAVGPKATA